MLQRVATLLWLPSTETTTGLYYWTHNVYLESSDFTSPTQMRNHCYDKLRWGYTTQVGMGHWQAVDPTTGAVVWTNSFTTMNNGELPAAENYSLLIAARFRMWGDDGSYAYHLHRMPIDPLWVDGDRWTEDAQGSLEAQLNTMMLFSRFRTKTGADIVRWDVSREIVGWQLRHGTKRRSSRFWLP